MGGTIPPFAVCRGVITRPAELRVVRTWEACRPRVESRVWASLLGVTRPPPGLGAQGSVCREASDPDTGLGFPLYGFRDPAASGLAPAWAVRVPASVKPECGPEAFWLVLVSLFMTCGLRGKRKIKPTFLSSAPDASYCNRSFLFSPVATWGPGGLTVRPHGSRAQIPQPSNLGPRGSGQGQGRGYPAKSSMALMGEFLASGSVFGWAVQGCQMTSRGHHLQGHHLQGHDL